MHFSNSWVLEPRAGSHFEVLLLTCYQHSGTRAELQTVTIDVYAGTQKLFSCFNSKTSGSFATNIMIYNIGLVVRIALVAKYDWQHIGGWFLVDCTLPLCASSLAADCDSSLDWINEE